MSHLTRPALARVAAACAAAVPIAAVAPAPAGADDLIQYCTADALPVEELEQGATADISCDWIDPDEVPTFHPFRTMVGTHYDGTNGLGAILDVFGACGEGIAFGSGDPWNNIISSTRQRSCGVIKHFDNANFSGDVYVHDGAPGTVENLVSMSNRTSAITYD